MVSNDQAQLPGRLSGRNTLKNRDAGPVSCSGWIGSDSYDIPFPGLPLSACCAFSSADRFKRSRESSTPF